MMNLLPPSSIAPESYVDIAHFLTQYGKLLDADQLEAWLDLFDEDCHYEILSRENVSQDFALALVLCDNKNMLRDRISSLRIANIYNLHYDCHVLGLPSVTMTAPGAYDVECTYSLYQSNQEGVTRLFSVGRYRMVLLETAVGFRIRRQIIVTDTGAVMTLLATPI
jgi:anthranilate 1,2-dioxygenase small subunit